MPTRVMFGAGSLDQLPSVAARLGRKPFLVTGRSWARRSGVLARVERLLPGAELFEGVSSDPTTAACEEAVLRCREAACDFAVGLGGGSAIDLAKAVAGLVRNPGPCAEFIGTDKFAQGGLPIVAIPTTAGTGSEVTPYSVLVDSQKQAKGTIRDRALFPAVALLDPELTLSLPASVTAHTGLDALSQAMEGMVSNRSTPMGDVLALEACRVVKRWLPRAVEAPEDLEARGRMLYAAMLSGVVIAQSGTTIVHGMGYQYTLECGLPHGLANGLLLAPVFQYDARYLPEKVAAIATALGYPADATPESAAAQVGAAVHALLNEVGVSPAARDAGVEPEALGLFAERTYADHKRLRSQPGDPSLDDILTFFRHSCAGTLA